ncbi:MAG: outer membrane beta-barrel protein [Candidatus Kapaibacterium sp.]
MEIFSMQFLNSRYRVGMVVLLFLLPIAELQSQVGVGVGLASTGEDVFKAGGELEDLLRKDAENLTYDDLSGEIGFYGKAGFKKGFGGFRLAGDLSYVYFQNSQIKLTTFSVAQDTSVSATFEVGTTLIPVSLGLEYAIPISTVRPYVGVYPIYTFVNRTFTRLEGDMIAGVENVSAGENEFGLGFEGGLELAPVNNLTFTLSSRYTIANMFTADDDEGTFGLFQLGLSIWFGDIIGNEDEKGETSLEGGGE